MPRLATRGNTAWAVGHRPIPLRPSRAFAIARTSQRRCGPRLAAHNVTLEQIGQLSQAKVYDLAQPYYVGMPHFPTHPPFLFGLTKKHGDMMSENGTSSCADALALGTHVGTHIDALCHFSSNGRLHGGTEAAGAQSYGGGLERHTIDTVEPILRRGVLFDIAKLEGVAALPVDFVIRPDHLERCGVTLQAGDVALIR